MIKRFKEWINETYYADSTDAPEIASDMNRFNDLETQIKDFDRYRLTITNIYNTYKDEKDLINKLAAQKFIQKTENKKKMKFQNPILTLWAQSCEKRRELKDIDDQIKKWQEDIKNEEENIKNNPSSKESGQANIKLIQDKIKQKNIDLSKKQVEIVNLEKSAKDRLKSMQEDLKLSKKRLDMYRINKLSEK